MERASDKIIGRIMNDITCWARGIILFEGMAGADNPGVWSSDAGCIWSSDKYFQGGFYFDKDGYAFANTHPIYENADYTNRADYIAAVNPVTMLGIIAEIRQYRENKAMKESVYRLLSDTELNKLEELAKKAVSATLGSRWWLSKTATAIENSYGRTIVSITDDLDMDERKDYTFYILAVRPTAILPLIAEVKRHRNSRNEHRTPAGAGTLTGAENLELFGLES